MPVACLSAVVHETGKQGKGNTFESRQVRYIVSSPVSHWCFVVGALAWAPVCHNTCASYHSFSSERMQHLGLIYAYTHVVVDLKVLDSIVYDDDPEHIKISFDESVFSSWRMYFFSAKDLAKD